MKSPRTLVIFTNSFPYGVGESFFASELQILSESFEQIRIVPVACRGENPRTIPSNCTLDKTVADKVLSLSIFDVGRCVARAVFNPIFICELSRYFLKLYRIRYIKHFVGTWIKAREVQRWVEKMYRTESGDFREQLFYTYWLGGPTLGICMAKKKLGEPLKCVSRVHGIDVFEHRNGNEYLPFRSFIYNTINSVFSVSTKGKKYIQAKYPEATANINVSRLGVENPGKAQLKTVRRNVKLQLLSCSYVYPVKRLERIVDLVAQLQKREIDIFWTHIGDGPLFSKLKVYAGRNLEESSYHLLGALTTEAVSTYFRENVADVFINMSSSEGIPVSIMEAQSFGVPVLAFNVGGVSEIVNSQNGLIVEPDVSMEEIVTKLIAFLEDKDKRVKYGKNSYENYLVNFNADSNYHDFAQRLKALS